MVHSPAIMLANLRVKTIAVLDTFPGWFHLEFMRRLLSDQMPAGIDASGPGKLAAKMWFVGYCNRSCNDPFKLNNIEYALRAA